MRLSPETGKKDRQIPDFVDIAGQASNLGSTPILFGLNPLEIIGDNAVLILSSR